MADVFVLLGRALGAVRRQRSKLGLPNEQQVAIVVYEDHQSVIDVLKDIQDDLRSGMKTTELSLISRIDHADEPVVTILPTLVPNTD